jgi:hypothetical protein
MHHVEGFPKKHLNKKYARHHMSITLNFKPFWIILNPVPEVLPQSEPVQQDEEEEEEGVMEVWEARRDDRDFCQSNSPSRK